MKISPYNIFLFSTKDSGEYFDIAGFQTNNILNMGTEIFMKKKEIEI